jgi:hypothetical protein
MKAMLFTNAVLYLINAILWAWVARQPAIAVACGAISIGNFWFLRKLIDEGG